MAMRTHPQYSPTDSTRSAQHWSSLKALAWFLAGCIAICVPVALREIGLLVLAPVAVGIVYTLAHDARDESWWKAWAWLLSGWISLGALAVIVLWMEAIGETTDAGLGLAFLEILLGGYCVVGAFVILVLWGITGFVRGRARGVTTPLFAEVRDGKLPAASRKLLAASRKSPAATRLLENLRTVQPRISRHPIKTAVRCSVEDLERFLQRTIDIAGTSREQVAEGTISAVVGASDMPVVSKVRVVVSVREGIHFVYFDLRLDEEDPEGIVHARREVSEELHAELINMGVEEDEEMAATMEAR